MRRQLTKLPDGRWQRELVIEDHAADCTTAVMLPNLYWQETGRDDWEAAKIQFDREKSGLRLVPTVRQYDVSRDRVLEGSAELLTFRPYD